MIDSIRRGPPHDRHAVALSAAVVLLLTAAGCTHVPSTVYTPDLAGPIEDIQAVPGNELARGVVVGDRTIRITPDAPRPLGSGGLAEDTLFLYGGEGDDAWYLVIGGPETTGELVGCYRLTTPQVYDDGSHLIFRRDIDEGIRLPKGPTLTLPSPDPDTGLYPFEGHRLCIEADGTVSRSNLP